MSGERTQVAIVGGGIAGLALGHALGQRGVAAVVLEAGQRPGGNIRSERRAGWLCEWGPNGFLDNEPATLRLVAALGLGAELRPSSDLARRRWIVRDGRLRLLPARPPEFLRSDVLSVHGRLRVLLEWAQPARRGAGDESVFDFARRRIGREAAEVLVDAMVTGVYAGDARSLSLQGAFPRMRAMEEEHGGLFRALIAMRRAARARGDKASPGGPLGPPGVLTSFLGGMETLVQALACHLGERLRTDSPIVGLARGARGWRLEIKGGAPLEAEQVVLACPSWAAAPLLRSHDAELAAELAAIPSAPVAVVCLGYDERDLVGVVPGLGFLVPGRERSPILGTLFDTWLFPGRSPAGRVLWRAMLGGARDPGAVDLGDEQLVERVLGAFAGLLGLHAAPLVTYVVRHPRGIPQYPVGHPARLVRLDEQLARHPGLYLCGNSYRGIAMNSCIKEAETLAARLAGEPAAAPASADTP